VNIVILV